MIGTLFTINRDNIVRAGISEVTKDLSPDAPLEVTAHPHANGIDALILVDRGKGRIHEIVFKESAVADCLQQAEIRDAAQELIEKLAGEIRLAVVEILA